MAVLHRATITPTKAELLADWVPTQPWGSPGLEVVGGFRFDDPDGQVGVETMIVRTGEGRFLQAPLTYRPAPLAGAEQHLICTMEHSVLGPRWIYDGCADPVYVRELAACVLTGAPQAQAWLEGEDVPLEPAVRVTGSGSGSSDVAVPPIDTVVATSDAAGTVVEAGALRIVVRRRLDLPAPATASAATLTGTWAGVDDPVLLAHVA